MHRSTARRSASASVTGTSPGPPLAPCRKPSHSASRYGRPQIALLEPLDERLDRVAGPRPPLRAAPAPASGDARHLFLEDRQDVADPRGERGGELRERLAPRRDQLAGPRRGRRRLAAALAQPPLQLAACEPPVAARGAHMRNPARRRPGPERAGAHAEHARGRRHREQLAGDVVHSRGDPGVGHRLAHARPFLDRRPVEGPCRFVHRRPTIHGITSIVGSSESSRKVVGRRRTAPNRAKSMDSTAGSWILHSLLAATTNIGSATTIA